MSGGCIISFHDFNFHNSQLCDYRTSVKTYISMTYISLTACYNQRVMSINKTTDWLLTKN